MSIERRLQREIKDSKIRYSRENDDSPYKRYLMKRIDLINRVLENMKDPVTKLYEFPTCHRENVEFIPLNIDEKYEYHIDQHKGLEIKFSTRF
ncbi:MAG: hypothetical protein WBL46_03185 [Nitrososphaeraceae archaeon]